MLLALCLLLALALRPLAELLRLPFALLLVVLGLVAGAVVEWLALDIGLRWPHFREWVFTLLLPVLVFEAALHIRFAQLQKMLLLILLLALPVVVLSMLAIAALMYWGIAHAEGFPWLAALLCGAMLSATDPAVVAGLMARLGLPPSLLLVLEGESLFNDAVAVVLFSTFLTAALSGQDLAIGVMGLRFAWTLCGGLLLGGAVALLSRWLLARIQDEAAVTVFTLALVFATYLLAEHWLAVSGVTALLVLGISMATDSRPGIRQVWAHHAFVANVLVFVLMGLTVQWSMFSERYLAILLGIAAVLLTRAALLYPVMPLFKRLPGSPLVNRREQHVLVWGGLRGAIAAALALSLPLALDYWFTVQAVVYGAVLFGLLLQAPLLSALLRR